MQRAIAYLIIPALLIASLTIAYVYMPIEQTDKGEVEKRAFALVGLGLLLAMWACWFVAKLLARRTPDATDSAAFGDWRSEQVYNDTQTELRVVIEPWRDSYVLPPNQSLFVKVPDADNGQITQHRHDAQVRVVCENAGEFKVTMEGRDITHAMPATSHAG